ncbi:MAG: GLPGLI family protein [Siphonobacter sp.]
MKKVISLLCFVFITFCAYSQSSTVIDSIQVRCRYVFTYQQDSTDIDSKKSEDMILDIGKHSSVFYSLNLYKADSMWVIIKKEREKHGPEYAMGLTSSLPRTNFEYRLYKNYPENKLTTTDKLGINQFISEESSPVFTWKILPIQKELAGYSCQKATTSFAGRNYEAWFTTDLAIADGPYKFTGLPGLIISIADTQNYFSFELVELKKQNGVGSLVFIKNKNCQTISQKAYTQALKSNRENPVGTIEAQGISFEKTSEFNKMLVEYKKTNNNYIEK